MFNPPDPYPNPGSYTDVLKRMTQRVQQTGISDQIVSMLQQAYEKELAQSQVILSRPERKRLFQQVSKAILDDVLGKIGEAK
jgi:hypothetical protein